MDKSFETCNYERIVERNINECIGICKGMLSDDEFNESEKNFLIDFIEKNDIQNKDVIVKILYTELNDNKNSLDDLKIILTKVTGGTLTPSSKVKSMTTSLPIEKDLKTIEFENKTFCLTGTFPSAYGDRKQLANIIKDKGGVMKDSVPKLLDYLVIGEFGNSDWIHSSYGRKIEKVMENQKDSYCHTKIISESQLLLFLENK